MTPAQQAEEAKKRLREFINRSAAQHMRAWRAQWMPRKDVPEAQRMPFTDHL